MLNKKKTLALVLAASLAVVAGIFGVRQYQRRQYQQAVVEFSKAQARRHDEMAKKEEERRIKLSEQRRASWVQFVDTMNQRGREISAVPPRQLNLQQRIRLLAERYSVDPLRGLAIIRAAEGHGEGADGVDRELLNLPIQIDPDGVEWFCSGDKAARYIADLRYRAERDKALAEIRQQVTMPSEPVALR